MEQEIASTSSNTNNNKMDSTMSNQNNNNQNNNNQNEVKIDKKYGKFVLKDFSICLGPPIDINKLKKRQINSSEDTFGIDSRYPRRKKRRYSVLYPSEYIGPFILDDIIVKPKILEKPMKKMILDEPIVKKCKSEISFSKLNVVLQKLNETAIIEHNLKHSLKSNRFLSSNSDQNKSHNKKTELVNNCVNEIPPKTQKTTAKKSRQIPKINNGTPKRKIKSPDDISQRFSMLKHTLYERTKCRNSIHGQTISLRKLIKNNHYLFAKKNNCYRKMKNYGLKMIKEYCKTYEINKLIKKKMYNDAKQKLKDQSIRPNKFQESSIKKHKKINYKSNITKSIPDIVVIHLNKSDPSTLKNLDEVIDEYKKKMNNENLNAMQINNILYAYKRSQAYLPNEENVKLLKKCFNEYGLFGSLETNTNYNKYNNKMTSKQIELNDILSDYDSDEESSEMDTNEINEVQIIDEDFGKINKIPENIGANEANIIEKVLDNQLQIPKNLIDIKTEISSLEMNDGKIVEEVLENIIKLIENTNVINKISILGINDGNIIEEVLENNMNITENLSTTNTVISIQTIDEEDIIKDVLENVIEITENMYAMSTKTSALEIQYENNVKIVLENDTERTENLTDTKTKIFTHNIQHESNVEVVLEKDAEITGNQTDLKTKILTNEIHEKTIDEMVLENYIYLPENRNTTHTEINDKDIYKNDLVNGIKITENQNIKNIKISTLEFDNETTVEEILENDINMTENSENQETHKFNDEEIVHNVLENTIKMTENVHSTTTTTSTHEIEYENFVEVVLENDSEIIEFLDDKNTKISTHEMKCKNSIEELLENNIKIMEHSNATNIKKFTLEINNEDKVHDVMKNAKEITENVKITNTTTSTLQIEYENMVEVILENDSEVSENQENMNTTFCALEMDDDYIVQEVLENDINMTENQDSKNTEISTFEINNITEKVLENDITMTENLNCTNTEISAFEFNGNDIVQDDLENSIEITENLNIPNPEISTIEIEYDNIVEVVLENEVEVPEDINLINTVISTPKFDDRNITDEILETDVKMPENSNTINTEVSTIEIEYGNIIEITLDNDEEMTDNLNDTHTNIPLNENKYENIIVEVLDNDLDITEILDTNVSAFEIGVEIFENVLKTMLKNIINTCTINTDISGINESNFKNEFPANSNNMLVSSNFHMVGINFFHMLLLFQQTKLYHNINILDLFKSKCCINFNITQNSFTVIQLREHLISIVMTSNLNASTDINCPLLARDKVRENIFNNILKFLRDDKFFEESENDFTSVNMKEFFHSINDDENYFVEKNVQNENVDIIHKIPENTNNLIDEHAVIEKTNSKIDNSTNNNSSTNLSMDFIIDNSHKYLTKIMMDVFQKNYTYFKNMIVVEGFKFKKSKFQGHGMKLPINVRKIKVNMVSFIESYIKWIEYEYPIIERDDFDKLYINILKNMISQIKVNNIKTKYRSNMISNGNIIFEKVINYTLMRLYKKFKANKRILRSTTKRSIMPTLKNHSIQDKSNSNYINIGNDNQSIFDIKKNQVEENKIIEMNSVEFMDTNTIHSPSTSNSIYALCNNFHNASYNEVNNMGSSPITDYIDDNFIDYKIDNLINEDKFGTNIMYEDISDVEDDPMLYSCNNVNLDCNSLGYNEIGFDQIPMINTFDDASLDTNADTVNEMLELNLNFQQIKTEGESLLMTACEQLVCYTQQGDEIGLINNDLDIPILEDLPENVDMSYGFDNAGVLLPS